jgi:hypothetical protein
MAALHRGAARRHRASAEVHRLLAMRASDSAGPEAPVFLTCLAELLGATSALVALHGRQASSAVVISDRLAQEAYDLETVMAEGPALDAAKTGMSLSSSGDLLLDRWPRYGPAVASLGVRAALAVPLGPPAARFGVLCALGSRPELTEADATTLEGVASALTGVLLAGLDPGRADNGVLASLGAITSQDVLHQAVGMVCVQCACGPDDAADLIAARAFAEGSRMSDLAREIVAGRIRLSDI